jgi:hypothetical protein
LSAFRLVSATTQGALPVHFGGVAGGEAVLHVTYNLNAKGSLVNSMLPLFGPDLARCGPYPLQATDIEAGDHAFGGPNVPARATPMPAQIAQIGDYTALVCIADDQAGQDRAHRNRFALQIGRDIGYRAVNTTAPTGEG